MNIKLRISERDFKIKPKIYFNTETNMYNYFENKKIKYRGKYKKGLILKNFNNDKYIIKGICGLKHDNRKVFIVEFIDTKFQIHVTNNQISSGNIKDFFKPSVCGIGYLGYGDYKKSSDYSHWRSLIKRVYDINHKSNKYYKSVEVCKRWHSFENFQDDLPLIQGFDRRKFENDEIVLDKDIGCYNLNYDIYNINTCQYIPRELNDKIQFKHQNFMEFQCYVNDVSVKFIHYNKAFIKDKLNLKLRGINRVLDSKGKRYKGWKIKTVKPDTISLKFLKDMDIIVEAIARNYGRW